MTTTQLDAILHIDGAHLWDMLAQQARIGATPKGGVRCLTLTDLNRWGRDFFVTQAGAAGCAVRVDVIGNLFARRPGYNNALSPIMTGSHIDMQPAGGKFDGSYGVFAGIKVMHTLNDVGIETEALIGVAVWINEKGLRFVLVMMGPGVFIGEFALDAVLAAQDRDGVAVGGALRSIGYVGSESVGGRAVGAYFEAHIEQGSVLEVHGKTIDVVTGTFGQRWYDVVLTSMEVRAGPTPMELRRDVLLPTAEPIGIANRIAPERPPHVCATVGCLSVYPDSRNVIPGQVSMTIDFRAADDTVLSDMDAALHEVMAESRTRSGIDIVLCQVVYFPPQPLDAMLANAVRSGARQLGLSEMDVISGAGHDAVYLARVAPIAMISVSYKDGISHNEIGDARPKHLEIRANALLRTALQAADRA